MEPVRWGIMSVSGHYMLRHTSAALAHPRGKIVAIASRGKEKAVEAASRLGIAKAYGSYAELLADPEIEAVYIPLPNSLHAECAIAAVEAGKHVLCEKPFALNAGQAKAMTVAAAKAERLIMEAFMYRFHPQWVRAREIVASGEIGRLRAIQSWFTYDNSDPANIRNKRRRAEGHCTT